MRRALAPLLLVALAYLPFVAGCVAIWLVSDMPRPWLPEALKFRFSDKLLHALAYGGLASLALFGAATKRRDVTRAACVKAAALAALYGVVDEVHQSFVPGRSATISDAIADLLGAVAFVALARVVWARWLTSRGGPRRA